MTVNCYLSNAAYAGAVLDTADIGDWTTPVPKVRDTSTYSLTNILQPGSRLIYISSSVGVDSTNLALASYYFWDGTNIIDASGSATGAGSVAYGTDPLNPTGPILPYATFNYAGPKQAGEDIGVAGATGSVTFTITAGTRKDFPDWWLFKRGDTFDLNTDLAGSTSRSLSTPGSSSADYPQIVGAYGPTASARPKFTHPPGGFISRYYDVNRMTWKNVWYMGLHFDGHNRASGTDFSSLMWLHVADSTGIFFEDCWIDGNSGFSPRFGGACRMRRCIISDAFLVGAGHVQGMFTNDSASTLRFKVEDSILYRNGFESEDPSLNWPPSGGTLDWNIFCRNMYLTGPVNHAESGLYNTVDLLGGSGTQFRHGWRAEGNFFYTGYVVFNGFGGNSGDQPNSGVFRNNVLQCFKATTGTTAAHPAWGLILGHSAQGVRVDGNIVTRAQCGRAAGASSWGLQLKTINDDDYNPVSRQLRYNVVTDNIFDCGVSANGVDVQDGTTNPAYGWTNPGLTKNEVTRNVFAYSAGSLMAYTATGGASGNDTYAPTSGAAANRTYATMAAAAATEGYTDTERTLKTYLQALGITVSSTDGVPEYIAIAQTMKRGTWRNDMEAKAIVNYIRQGFGKPALA